MDTGQPTVDTTVMGRNAKITGGVKMKPIYSCKTCKLCKKKIQVNHGIFLHFAADCLLDLKGSLHIWKNHRERIVEKKKSVFRLLRTMFMRFILIASKQLIKWQRY
jgi:hypothetical protein